MSFTVEPVSRVVRHRVEILERVDLRHHHGADLSGRDDLPDSHESRIEPAIVCDAKCYTIRATCRDHGVALFHGHRHRFLAQHVLACLCGGDRMFGVEVHGRREVDGVDVRVSEQLGGRRIPATRPELACECLRVLRLLSTDGNQVARREIAQRRRDAFAGDVARADQFPSQRHAAPRVAHDSQTTSYPSLPPPVPLAAILNRVGADEQVCGESRHAMARIHLNRLCAPLTASNRSPDARRGDPAMESRVTHWCRRSPLQRRLAQSRGGRYDGARPTRFPDARS